MKTVKVKVTQSHIDKAKELVNDSVLNRAFCCPIALALKDVFQSECFAPKSETAELIYRTRLFNLLRLLTSANQSDRLSLKSRANQ
jgi:hypothetical protein